MVADLVKVAGQAIVQNLQNVLFRFLSAEKVNL
jgi:hypothetical protein